MFMIVHIVLFKLKDGSPESVDSARGVLEGLRGKIPVLRSLEVGVDILRTERSYDLALTAVFDSLDDLQAYQVHPAHQEVIAYMGRVRESAVAVDYRRP
jgi:hypothetical protein